MIYGIILIILYFISIVYNLYIARTPDSKQKFYLKESETVDTKLVHYIKYFIIAVTNFSILGYLIYAITCL